VTSSHFAELNISNEKLLNEKDSREVMFNTQFCIILFGEVLKVWP